MIDGDALPLHGFVILTLVGVVVGILRQERNVRPLRGATQETVAKVTGQLERIYEQVDELYKLHDVKDRNGLPVWYVRRSLEDSIEKLSEAIDKQTALMGQISSLLQNTIEASKRIADQDREEHKEIQKLIREVHEVP